MAISGVKENPRILLLAGGIEFQRADLKLSSMDTLIEQENKFMEILVDKIMSLRPGTYQHNTVIQGNKFSRFLFP